METQKLKSFAELRALLIEEAESESEKEDRKRELEVTILTHIPYIDFFAKSERLGETESYLDTSQN
jgi:hypothetical protein